MPDEKEEESPHSPSNTESEISPGEIIPTNVEPVNTNPDTKNMEVHHHTYHGHEKKTLKNYFWEFFMLFMAVFCGSLAELQVEHYIENQRESKYAQTLLEDLLGDTLDLHQDILGWNMKVAKVDTIRSEIEKPLAMRDHQLLYSCVTVLTINNTFLYHDRTIQQLKSAGNFRLIRKGNISDSLINYDAWIQTTLHDIENIYGHIISPEISRLQNQLFNSKFYSIARNRTLFDSAAHAEPLTIEIAGGKEDILFQFYNELFEYKRLNLVRVAILKQLLRQATNLIEMIRRQYHLE